MEGQRLSKGYPRFLVNVADKGLTAPVSSLDTALTQLVILKGLTSLCVPRRIWVTRSVPRHSVMASGDAAWGFLHRVPRAWSSPRRMVGGSAEIWFAAGRRMAAERLPLRKPAVGVPLKKK
jgi:hypothetical protein